MKKKRQKAIFIPAPNAFGNFDVIFRPKGSTSIGTVENYFYKLRKVNPKHI